MIYITIIAAIIMVLAYLVLTVEIKDIDRRD